MTITRNSKGKCRRNSRVERKEVYRDEFSLNDAVGLILGVNATEKLKAKRLLTQAIYFFITLEIYVNYTRNAIMSVKRLLKQYAFHSGQVLSARFKITVKRFRCISDVTF